MALKKPFGCLLLLVITVLIRSPYSGKNQIFGLSYGDGWTNNRLSWDPVHGWTDGDRNENHDLLDSRSLSLKKADWRIKLVNGSIHYIKMTSIKAKNADGMITISFCTDTEDGAHEFLLKLKK